jgi:hypothetical protein
MRNRWLHISLAYLLILSQTGLSINTHFCQGKRKQSSVFTQAPTCHSKSVKAEMPASCPMHAQMMDEKSCCDNESSYHKSDIDQWVTATVMPGTPVAVVLPNPWTPRLITPSLRGVFPPVYESPPKIFSDLGILFQVFRL